MAFDFQPVDYAGMLGLRNQPDPRVLAQQQQQIDLQRQQQAAQMAQLQQKQQAAQAYTADVQQYLKNPTPEAGQQLLLRHPDQAEAFKTYFQQRDQQAQDSDFKEMVRLDGLLSVGRAEEAKAALQARIDAGKAAGRPTPDEEMLLAQLNDDPKKAQGMLSVLIPSIGGVENYAKILEQRRLASGKAGDPFTLAPGEARYDAAGNLIASSAYKPQIIGDAEHGYFEYNQGGGASGSPVSPGAVFERMIGAESNSQQFTNGKPTTSSKGAVGIAQVMPGTAPEAARLAGVEWSPEKYRNDADYNRQIGEAYFTKRLLPEFGGDVRKAVAAYNAGPGRVQRAVEKGGEAWERRLPAETQNYLRTVLAGTDGQNAGAPSGPNVRQLTPAFSTKAAPLTREEKVSEGLDPSLAYYRGTDGVPKLVEGQTKAPTIRKEEANLRKEFDQLPEVKAFKTVRTAYRQIDDIVNKKNPTAADDISLIFSFMKTLDPTSVVREGEFATAQNAGGVADNIRNQYNRALSGTRLNPQQRINMRNSAATYYHPVRDAYNVSARKYRGYASDSGYDPEHVAQEYLPSRQWDRAGGAAATAQHPADINAIMRKYGVR